MPPSRDNTNRAIQMVDEICAKNTSGLTDRVKARESTALNPQHVYADLNAPGQAVTGSELNLHWVQARSAADLERDRPHWGKFASVAYGERGSTAHVVLHPDEEAFQGERTTDGFARLSQAPPKTVTSCNKAAYDDVACAQCGWPPHMRPIFGRQTISQVWREKYQKYVADDKNGDIETRDERAERAADAAVATFMHEFFLGGERRRQVLVDTHYCAERACRMAAGAITIEQQAMYIQTGEDPRFDHNVRHGWKEDLINDARHLRMAYCDPAVQRNETTRKRYERNMESLVQHVRQDSFWIRNQEKQYVATASLLVIHCEAFGLCFGTEQEQRTFAQQMGQAPKEMFDKLVTEHVLSRSWHGCTLDDLSNNKRLRGTAGSGCKTWDSTLGGDILGSGWPTPQATAMVHRIVNNFVSMQCPFDGETPLHQVRPHPELRYWRGNEDQNELIKGPFDAVNAIVGKLNNTRSCGNVYKALMTANKGAPSYHVHEVARVLGEPGRQDDALVRRSTKPSVAYAACDNTSSGVTRQHLDMPAQLRASVIGLRMEENIGTVLSKYLPPWVHAAGQKAKLSAGTYFLRNQLPQLVFTPLSDPVTGNTMGHAFVQPTVAEAVGEIQGAFNRARRRAAARSSKAAACIGMVKEVVHSAFAGKVSRKLLGGVSKSGFRLSPLDKNGRPDPKRRKQLPRILQDELAAQDASKRTAPLVATRILLHVLRGNADPRNAAAWRWGPKLKILGKFEPMPTHPPQLVTLVDAHPYFMNLLKDWGPDPSIGRVCRIHTMSMEDVLGLIEGDRDKQYKTLGTYVEAMIFASESYVAIFKETWAAAYTHPLVDALRGLKAALANRTAPSRVPAYLQAASIRTEPCDPAECPELQAGAMAQLAANYDRDFANGTVTCTFKEYRTRDMYTRSRIGDQRELQVFERFQALGLSESFESYQAAHRIDEPDVPFTDSLFTTELSRRTQYAERVACNAQRKLTDRTMKALKRTNVPEKKNEYRDEYMGRAFIIDEGLRPKLEAFINYRPPMYGPHLQHWYLYAKEMQLWAGGAGRQHAQMRDAASNGRRNASKLDAEHGPMARVRIKQVWDLPTAEARAAERTKLFDAHIRTYNRGKDTRKEKEEQAVATREAGLAKFKAAAEGGGDAEAALDALEASPAKKAKPQTPHEWHRDLKKKTKEQEAEAHANGFKQMHEGLRKIGPDGKVEAHTSMMGAFREYTKDMTEDEKKALLPSTMRKGKAPKKDKAPKEPKEPKSPAKRARGGRRRVVVSDSDSSDADDAPAISELRRAPVLDEEEEEADDSTDDEEEGEEQAAPAEGDDDDAGPDNADEDEEDEGQYRDE